MRRATVVRSTASVAGAAGLAGAAIAGRWVHAKIGTVPAPVGFTASSEELAHAVELLQQHPAVDMHAHPGRTFVRGMAHLSPPVRLYALRGSFEERAVADLHAGHVAAAVFNAVPDFPTLGVSRTSGLVMRRAFQPGEGWATYRTQIANLRQVARGDGTQPALDPDGVQAARQAGALAAVLGVEGCDFLDGDLGRIAQVVQDDVRVVTLVHFYRGGPIGDIMTEPPVHGGLTRFGRDVVREMNAAGLVIDLSHASEGTAYDALEVSDRPLLLSHTDIATAPGAHPRFVSVDLAQTVAAAGGVIGAWPAGITLRSLDDFAARIVELIDMVGADHVGIGTDMDANDRPVFESYAKMPLLVAALLRRGVDDQTLTQVLGGNFLRVMAAAQRR